MAAAKKSTRSSKSSRSSKKRPATRTASKKPAAKKPATKKRAARASTSKKPATKKTVKRASVPKRAPASSRASASAAPSPEPQRAPPVARPVNERSVPIGRQFEEPAARQPIRNDREPWKPVFTIKPCFIVVLRVLLGFTFLWAFLDKAFGLGYSTKSAAAWIHGGSPTAGFLVHGTQGFLAPFFQSIAYSPIVAWLFMLGLLFVGLSFVFGTKVRLASYAGALMLFLMYLAVGTWIPGSTNPLIDDHIVYAILMLAIGHARYAVRWDVVRNWWVRLLMVKRRSWLA